MQKTGLASCDTSIRNQQDILSLFPRVMSSSHIQASGLHMPCICFSTCSSHHTFPSCVNSTPIPLGRKQSGPRPIRRTRVSPSFPLLSCRARTNGQSQGTNKAREDGFGLVPAAAGPSLNTLPEKWGDQSILSCMFLGVECLPHRACSGAWCDVLMCKGCGVVLDEEGVDCMYVG